MSELIKEIILGLNKPTLDNLDMVKITTVVEAYLNIPDLDFAEITLLQILFGYLEHFENQLNSNPFLKNMLKELKLKTLRIGLNKMDEISPSEQPCETDMPNNFNKRIINNVQVHKPLKDAGIISIVDHIQFEDGTIEKRKLFDIHPDLVDIEMDSPLFNDYAQIAINTAKK